MIGKIKSVYRFISPKFQSIHLEYKVTPKPRYGHGKPAHTLLLDLINRNRPVYKDLLNSFLKYIERIHDIKDSIQEADENNPAWNNSFLPGLDIVGIYGIIAKYKPAKYIEIGS